MAAANGLIGVLAVFLVLGLLYEPGCETSKQPVLRDAAGARPLALSPQAAAVQASGIPTPPEDSTAPPAFVSASAAGDAPGCPPRRG